MNRSGWRRSYYEWLSKYDTSPRDSYNKSWLSSVTPGECAGAETLADVMVQFHEVEDGHERARRDLEEVTSLAHSRGHKFSVDLICSDCSRSWEDHQEIRSPCRGHELARYVEPRDAPKESEAERRKRVERFSDLYPD